jgi:hypothetical protein
MFLTCRYLKKKKKMKTRNRAVDGFGDESDGEPIDLRRPERTTAPLWATNDAPPDLKGLQRKQGGIKPKADGSAKRKRNDPSIQKAREDAQLAYKALKSRRQK